MRLLPQICCPCQGCCLPASLLFGLWGLVQVLFDASKSGHKLLSESAWPDACALWAHWHIPAETGRLVATAGLWWMRRRWLTERSAWQQLVCKHASDHSVRVRYCWFKSHLSLCHQWKVQWCSVISHITKRWCKNPLSFTMSKTLSECADCAAV